MLGATKTPPSINALVPTTASVHNLMPTSRQRGCRILYNTTATAAPRNPALTTQLPTFSTPAPPLNGALVGFTAPVPVAPAVPAAEPLTTVGYGALFSSAAEMASATHCVDVGAAVNELRVTLMFEMGDAEGRVPLVVALGEEGRKKM